MSIVNPQMSAGRVTRYTEERYPLLRKFTVGQHPLLKEGSMREMKPLTMTEKGVMDTLIRQMTVDGDEDLGTLSPHVVQKWRQKQMLQALPDNVQHWWVSEFTKWLRGVSVFNDRQVTPWGNHNLFHVPGVVEYLKELLRMRADYQFRLMAMTVLTPKTLEDCFLFYKYIVTGHGLCMRDYGDGTGGFYRAGDGSNDDTESLPYMTVYGMLDFLDDYSLTTFYERDLRLQQTPQAPLPAEDTDALRQTSNKEPPHVTMPDAAPQTQTQSSAPDAPRGPESDAARDRQRRQQERDEEQRRTRRRQEKEKARAEYLAATREATEARSRLDAQMLGAMQSLSQSLQQQQQQLAQARVHDMDQLRRDRDTELGKVSSMADTARIEREFQEREQRLAASFEERLRHLEAAGAAERQQSEAAHQRRIAELSSAQRKASKEASQKIAALELAHQAERQRHAQETGEFTTRVQQLSQQLQAAGQSSAQIEHAAQQLQHQQQLIAQLEQRAALAEGRQQELQATHARELEQVRNEMRAEVSRKLADSKFAQDMGKQEREQMFARLRALEAEHQQSLEQLRATVADKEQLTMRTLQQQQVYQEQLTNVGMELSGVKQQYEQRVGELEAAFTQQTQATEFQQTVAQELHKEVENLRGLLALQEQNFAAQMEAHQVNATIENSKLRSELEGRVNAYDSMDIADHPGAATQLALVAQNDLGNSNELALIRESALGMLNSDYGTLAVTTAKSAPLAARTNLYNALAAHFFNPALDQDTRIQILTAMSDALPRLFPWVNEESFKNELQGVLADMFNNDVAKARSDLVDLIGDVYIGQYLGERKAVGGPAYTAVATDNSSYVAHLQELMGNPMGQKATLEASRPVKQLTDFEPIVEEIDVDENIGGARVMLLEFSEAPAESATQLALRNFTGELAPINNANPFREAVLHELQSVKASGHPVGELQLAARTSLTIEPYVAAELPATEAYIRAGAPVVNRQYLVNLRDMLRFQQAQENIQARLIQEAGAAGGSREIVSLAQERAQERAEHAEYYAERVRLIDFALSRDTAQKALDSGALANHPVAQQMMDLIQTLARGSFQEAYSAYGLFEQRVLNSNQAVAVGAS